MTLLRPCSPGSAGDEAELVAAWIRHHLKLCVVVFSDDAANLSCPQLFRLINRGIEIVDLHVEVHPVLGRLLLRHALKADVEAHVIAVEYRPVGTLHVYIAPDQCLPKARKCLRIRAIEHNLV